MKQHLPQTALQQAGGYCKRAGKVALSAGSFAAATGMPEELVSITFQAAFCNALGNLEGK